MTVASLHLIANIYRVMDRSQVSIVLFQGSSVVAEEQEVLERIDALKQTLRHRLHEPRRWFGSIRRLSVARAIQGSNTIEGYDATLDDAAAVAVGEAPLDADEETRRALEGYRSAMTYVLQLAEEPDFEYSTRLVKSLHFMMTSYDLKSRPGLWRSGTAFVFNEESGEVVYEGADVDLVPGLMAALVERLNESDDLPPLVRAAMAHLNLVLIHPFRDGNGRMAQCLQSLVLAREKTPLSPFLLSIEEYLGRNTQAYYNVLAQVGNGTWQPERDTRPWIRFTLTAHLRQAQTMVRRIQEAERMWSELESLVDELSLSERTVIALFDAAQRLRVRNATYRVSFAESGEELSEQTATRDLRQLVEAGLLIPNGASRGRFYVASSRLAKIRQAIVRDRDPRDDSDLFGAT